MPPQTATLIYATGIIGLFVLSRDRKLRISKALWIPVAWLAINASRQVSLWLQLAPKMQSVSQFEEGSPFDAAVFGFLIAAGILVLLRRSRKASALLRANWPILLYCLYCVVSLLWSDFAFVAFKRWIKAVGDVVMVLVVLTEPEPLAALKRFFAQPAFLLIPLSVLLIKYYPDLGREYNPWSGEPMYTGVTTTKNGLGMICLIFGLTGVWRLLYAYREPKGGARTRHLLAEGILMAIVLWLFRIVDSMTSLSCFIMAGGLLVALTMTKLAKKPRLVHLCVLAAVTLSISALFLNVGGGVLGAMGRNSSLTGRTEIWSIVLSLVNNPILGTGFESFWLGHRLQVVWEGFGLHIQEAHNGYLEVYLNLGWVGVALLAVLIVTGYRNVMRALRSKQDGGELKLAFFVAAVIYSLTEAGFRMMTPVWIIFLLAIMNVPQVAPQELQSLETESQQYAEVGWSQVGSS